MMVGCQADPRGRPLILTAVGTTPAFVSRWELVHETPALAEAALNEDGTEGWAVGAAGVILHFKDGRWEKAQSPASLGQVDLKHVALSRDGKSGWAVGDQNVWLKLQDGKWAIEHQAPSGSSVLPAALGVRNDGSGGWAFGWHGQAWHLVNGRWLHQIIGTRLFPDGELASGIDPYTVAAVAVSEDGRTAWAVGARFGALEAALHGGGYSTGGFVLTYGSGLWSRAKVPFELPTLTAVSLRADGREGWAVGKGCIAHYDQSGWTVDRRVALKAPSSIWFDFVRRRGWMITGSELLSFQKDRWEEVPLKIAVSRSSRLAVSAVGAVGFVVGDGGLELQLEHGQWRRVAHPGDLLYGTYLARVRVAEDGRHGWMVANSYDLFDLGRQGWEPRREVHPAATDFDLAADGATGWAVGEGGEVVSYANHAWTADRKASALTRAMLRSVCVSADGLRGWAVGEGGAVLALEGSSWNVRSNLIAASGGARFGRVWCSSDGRTALAQVDSSRSRVFSLPTGVWQRFVGAGQGGGFRSLWIGPEGTIWEPTMEAMLRWAPSASAALQEPIDPKPLFIDSLTLTSDLHRGWAAGESLFVRRGGGWLRDEQFGSLTKSFIRSISIAKQENDGWAVGVHGAVLRYRPIPVGSIRMTPSVSAALDRFQGSFDLSFPAPLGELPTFALYTEDKPDAPQSLSSTEYQLERLDPSTSFRLTFQPQAAVRAGQLKGERCALEVRAHYYHPSLPLDVTYRSDAFYLAGMSWERRAIYAGLGVVALNFMLLLGAMRFAALRKVVLNPAAANVAGLVVAKYLVTDQVIRHVRMVRLALFRDYRRRLSDSVALRWQDRLYVAPQVEVAGCVQAGAVRWAAEPAWRQVFRVILGQPRRRLWLVEGPSGLGKTALLEQWLAMALEIGATPLLISLRGSSPAIHEAAVLLSQHGDVKISDELALSLVESGGFVLLLDGLNEDGSPEATRDFVRIVSRNNLVVLTSQFDPRWEASITTCRISLKPFGREQLVQLLDPSWADRILASATLSSEVARLPVTAKLLAQCIRKQGILPRARLDIYRGLLAGLEGGQLLNLEARRGRCSKPTSSRSRLARACHATSASSVWREAC
jgi:hypothetical protein